MLFGVSKELSLLSINVMKNNLDSPPFGRKILFQINVVSQPRAGAAQVVTLVLQDPGLPLRRQRRGVLLDGRGPAAVVARQQDPRRGRI
ncbi:jg18102, partial [Pararge aegeria aegeria]